MAAKPSLTFPVKDSTGATVQAQTIPIDDGGFLPTANVAGEAHVGQVGGDTAIAVGNMVRLANTTAYASGQLVGNNASAASVTPIELTVARKVAGTGRISRARLTRSKAEAGSFRVHLYRAIPVSAVADGGAYLTDGALNYLGAFDCLADRLFTDGAKGFGVPVTGPFIAFDCAAGSQKLYALIEARGVVTPASGETLTVALEVDRD